MANAVVIAAHPGVGKTMLGKRYQNVLDLESSTFRWIYPGPIKDFPKELRKGVKQRTQNPKWPQNYIEEIEKKQSSL